MIRWTEESSRKKSGKFSGNFPEISWNFPGNFQEKSLKLPRKLPGMDPKTSRKFSEICPKNPENDPEIICELSSVNRTHADLTSNSKMIT